MALANGGSGLGDVQFKLLALEAAMRDQKELFIAAALATIADALCGTWTMQQQYQQLFGEPLEAAIATFRKVWDKWKSESSLSPSTI